MLFKPISASIWKSCQGTLGGGCNSLSPSLLSFIPPSSISLSSELASGFCPHICYLIPLLDSFQLLILVIFPPLNANLSLWQPGIIPPSLRLSLSIAGSVCRSPVRPSFRPCTRRSESVRQLGGWEAGLEGLTSCVVVDSVLVWSCPSLWSPAGLSRSPHPFSVAAWTASGCPGSSFEHTGGRNPMNASCEWNCVDRIFKNVTNNSVQQEKKRI